MQLTRRGRYCFQLLPIAAFFLFPSLAAADGGALRLSEQKDGYRTAVFTTPTPLRAGPVDFSVLVQDAATGEAEPGIEVSIKVQRPDNRGTALVQRATTQAATNKLYYAATFNLPEAGWYSVEVSIVGPLGETQVRFNVEAAGALPPGLAMLPWVGWPLLAIAIFSIHQLLVRWKSL
jgi:hypothetical protein